MDSVWHKFRFLYRLQVIWLCNFRGLALELQAICVLIWVGI